MASLCKDIALIMVLICRKEFMFLLLFVIYFFVNGTTLRMFCVGVPLNSQSIYFKFHFPRTSVYRQHLNHPKVTLLQ